KNCANQQSKPSHAISSHTERQTASQHRYDRDGREWTRHIGASRPVAACRLRPSRDAPCLVFCEGTQGFGADVAAPCGSQRELGDRLVVRRVTNDDSVVLAHRQVERDELRADRLPGLPRVRKTLRKVLERLHTLLRVMNERDVGRIRALLSPSVDEVVPSASSTVTD